MKSNSNTIAADIATIATNTLALVQSQQEQEELLRPYAMFKYSIRSELTRKYYERRLKNS
jgi:hypothetical protein